MNVKRQIPKDLILLIEPILNEYEQQIKVVDTQDENCVVKIVDKDYSDYYYKIIERKLSGGAYRTWVEGKPTSKLIEKWDKILVDKDLTINLKNWCELVKFYQKPSIFDGLIVESNNKGDDDTILTFEQKEKIGKFLESSLEILEDNKTKIPQEEYNKIHNEIKEAQENLEKDTKIKMRQRMESILKSTEKYEFLFKFLFDKAVDIGIIISAHYYLLH